MISNQTYLSAKGPKTLKHRYLEEDLPYGIMPLLALGRAYEIPMPRMQAMVECLCCLLGENSAPKEFSLSRDDLDVLVHTLKYE